MKELDKILLLEEDRWRQEPYHKYLEMSNGGYYYEIKHNSKKYEIEIHTKKSDQNDEIIVMVEVSKQTKIGIFTGKAKYFAINRQNTTRDATPDEAF